MRLGILVTKREYSNYFVPVIAAAVNRGDKVTVFFMDDGCFAATDPALKEYLGKITATVCDLNRRERDVQLPPEVHTGTQYDNLNMIRESEKVLVF